MTANNLRNGDGRLLLDVREVAYALGIGVRTVWRLSSRGDLPTPISIGRARRRVRADVEAAVARLVEAQRR